MADIRYKIDYKEPENVASEVPGEQKIREGGDCSEDNVETPTLDSEDKVENPADYTLSPVVTITKNEASYTKGDLKLQKVSVTENVSVIRNGIFHTVKPDSYPPLHSDVLREQPIRMDPGSPEGGERKTRIPTRFKQAAGRVRRERSMPNRIDGEITVPTHPRRSSIPRLKPRTPKPEEEEFDKIYDEIVDSPVDIDVSLLNNNLDDPIKVETRFEEIIHDYDEGKIKPISVEPVTNTPTVTEDNAKQTAAPRRDSPGTENKVVEQITSERGVSIEKPKSRFERASSSDTQAPKEINNKAPNRPVDKISNTEKPKSRIPMLKRKSEAEIEVPKSVAPKNSVFGNRMRVQDAISRFSKEDDKAKKLPSRIAVSKKIVVDDDNVKGIYQETASRTVKNGDKYELQTENVEVKVSYESRVGPENIINYDVSDALNETVTEGNAIEIIEITPAMEPVEISNDFNEPCIVEIEECPPTAPISEINNYNFCIQEITEANPPLVEELQPNQELNKVDIEPAVKLTPVKVVSSEEMERMINDAPKSARPPQYIFKADLPKNTDVNMENGHVSQHINYISDNIDENEIARQTNPIARQNGSANDNNQLEDIKNKDDIHESNKIISMRRDSYEDAPIIRGKVSRMIGRLVSKDEKDEPKKEPIEELPKPKTVLSKIAMFERQEPAEDIPKPKRDGQKRCRYIPDHKPKIIHEILKPVSSKEFSNEEPLSLEASHSIGKALQVEAVNMEVIPISTVVAEEVKYEEAIVDEVQPLNDSVGGISEARNGDVIVNNRYREEVPNGIELTPVQIEYIEPARILLEFEPKVNENKEEDKPIKFEFVDPIKKPVDNATNDYIKEDIVFIEKEKVLYNTPKKNIPESPFDFTPKENGNRVRNYDEDYHTNDTPSLDCVLDRLGKYKSTFDDSNLKKPKSVAELDIGDAVKGKVHDMIVRMKSVDKLSEKREVISAKERPRKKSVFEKIALFEGKLNQTTTQNPSSRSLKADQKRMQEMLSPEEVKTRIADLSAASLKYGRATNMTYVVLQNGQEMPVLATGTALLDKQIAAHVVAAAIDLGYRAIDCAYIYGNEREVGEGIRAKIQDGTVTREELFVINKLWSTCHREDLVEEACRRSLDAMGLEYFDLYLIHNPMSFKEGKDPIPRIASVIQYSKHDYLEAWYGMEALAARGLARGVGVSNFNSAQLQRVLDRARIKPVVNMVECHPYLSQQRLSDFCADRHIKLLTYGALGSKGTPAELKGHTAAAIDDPLVQVMAAGLGVSPAQLLIRYQIECGHAVVTKASTASHLWDNLQALSVSLSDGHVDALRALNRNKRAFTFKGMGDTHKNYPFNTAF